MGLFTALLCVLQGLYHLHETGKMHRDIKVRRDASHASLLIRSLSKTSCLSTGRQHPFDRTRGCQTGSAQIWTRTCFVRLIIGSGCTNLIPCVHVPCSGFRCGSGDQCLCRQKEVFHRDTLLVRALVLVHNRVDTRTEGILTPTLRMIRSSRFLLTLVGRAEKKNVPFVPRVVRCVLS